MSTIPSDSINLQVSKRNGARVSYERSRIRIAINKAFTAAIESEGLAHTPQTRTELIQRSIEQSEALSQAVTNDFQKQFPYGGTIAIETIQDTVERYLMASGENIVAKKYMLYREERRKLREQENNQRHWYKR